MDEPQENPNQVPSREQSARNGIVVMVIGAVLAFFPILMAILNTAPGHNWMSEGDSQSGGAYIWLMLFTLPIGSTIGIFGLVKLIQARNSRRQPNQSKKPSRKNTVFAVILILIGLSFLSDGLMNVLMIGANLDFAGQAVINLAVGIGLLVFGIRIARGKS